MVVFIRKALLDGDREEVEKIYYQMIEYMEYIMEERCYMADALAVVPADELEWYDLYWEKMNKMDEIMDWCESKRGEM